MHRRRPKWIRAEENRRWNSCPRTRRSTRSASRSPRRSRRTPPLTAGTTPRAIPPPTPSGSIATSPLLAFPGGAVDMIDAWFAHIDRTMADLLPAERLAPMKVRDRITALIEARLAEIAPNREALRRGVAILAMPQNIARGARLGWRAADLMWRAAGDLSTDYNHYTKRMILAGVYAATITIFLNDESEGLGGHPRLSGASYRRNHAFRKGQGGLRQAHRTSPQPVAVHRAAPLSGDLAEPWIKEPEFILSHHPREKSRDPLLHRRWERSQIARGAKVTGGSIRRLHSSRNCV